MTAAAPSLTPEELPAVTVPPCGTASVVWRACRALVSRGCSSRSTTVGSPCGRGSSTGAISRASRPRFCAAAARCWLRSAKASWSAREKPNSRGDVLGGLGHEIDAIRVPHQGIDEAPADRRVVDFGVAREGFALALHERRARHPFNAARNDELGFAGLDRPRRDRNRVEPEPQSRLTVAPGTVDGQAGEERRHARDVAIVFARPVGAAGKTSSIASRSSPDGPGERRPIGTRRESSARTGESAPP